MTWMTSSAPTPSWMHLMAKRKRKTLVVCEQCHQNIHTGRATATTRK